MSVPILNDADLDVLFIDGNNPFIHNDLDDDLFSLLFNGTPVSDDDGGNGAHANDNIINDTNTQSAEPIVSQGIPTDGINRDVSHVSHAHDGTNRDIFHACNGVEPNASHARNAAEPNATHASATHAEISVDASNLKDLIEFFKSPSYNKVSGMVLCNNTNKAMFTARNKASISFTDPLAGYNTLARGNFHPYEAQGLPSVLDRSQLLKIAAGTFRQLPLDILKGLPLDGPWLSVKLVSDLEIALKQIMESFTPVVSWPIASTSVVPKMVTLGATLQQLLHVPSDNQSTLGIPTELIPASFVHLSSLSGVLSVIQGLARVITDASLKREMTPLAYYIVAAMNSFYWTVVHMEHIRSDLLDLELDIEDPDDVAESYALYFAKCTKVVHMTDCIETIIISSDSFRFIQDVTTRRNLQKLILALVYIAAYLEAVQAKNVKSSNRLWHAVGALDLQDREINALAMIMDKQFDPTDSDNLNYYFGKIMPILERFQLHQNGHTGSLMFVSALALFLIKGPASLSYCTDPVWEPNLFLQPQHQLRVTTSQQVCELHNVDRFRAILQLVILTNLETYISIDRYRSLQQLVETITQYEFATAKLVILDMIDAFKIPEFDSSKRVLEPIYFLGDDQNYAILAVCIVLGKITIHTVFDAHNMGPTIRRFFPLFKEFRSRKYEQNEFRSTHCTVDPMCYSTHHLQGEISSVMEINPTHCSPLILSTRQLTRLPQLQKFRDSMMGVPYALHIDTNIGNTPVLTNIDDEEDEEDVSKIPTLNSLENTHLQDTSTTALSDLPEVTFEQLQHMEELYETHIFEAHEDGSTSPSTSQDSNSPSDVYYQLCPSRSSLLNSNKHIRLIIVGVDYHTARISDTLDCFLPFNYLIALSSGTAENEIVEIYEVNINTFEAFVIEDSITPSRQTVTQQQLLNPDFSPEDIVKLEALPQDQAFSFSTNTVLLSSMTPSDSVLQNAIAYFMITLRYRLFKQSPTTVIAITSDPNLPANKQPVYARVLCMDLYVMAGDKDIEADRADYERGHIPLSTYSCSGQYVNLSQLPNNDYNEEFRGNPTIIAMLQERLCNASNRALYRTMIPPIENSRWALIHVIGSTINAVMPALLTMSPYPYERSITPGDCIEVSHSLVIAMKANLEPFAIISHSSRNLGCCSFTVDGEPIVVIPTEISYIPTPPPTRTAIKCIEDFESKEATLLAAISYNPANLFSRYYGHIETLAREVVYVDDYEYYFKPSVTFRAYVLPHHDHLDIGHDESPFPMDENSPLARGYLPVTRFHSCTCFKYFPTEENPDPIELNLHAMDDIPSISYWPNRPTLSYPSDSANIN